MGAYGGTHDEDRARHAMNDPEIQILLKDPRIVQTLKDLQENPQSAQSALRDPFIGEAINKLIAAGIVKMA
jgi:stress-induced-phosphoprotein 1